MKYAFALLGIEIGLQLVLPAHGADATDNKTIVFVAIVHHIDDLVRESLQEKQ